MLRNTLILPETDVRLAARLLQEAIDALDLVLLIVFGKDAQSVQAVTWADKLASRTLLGDGRNPRKVIWIRDPDPSTMRAILDPIVGVGVSPRVAVLDFHDKLRGTLAPDQTFDPLTLELLFLKGQEVSSGGGS